MAAKRLSNIPHKNFVKFLEAISCKKVRTKGSHEQYVQADLDRPITINRSNPVSPLIVKNTLKILKLSREDFFRIMDEL